MQGRKTPAVAFITHLIKITGKTKLRKILQESPLTAQEVELVLDYTNGKSYKELAQKYHKSVQRINQWKRKIYENLTLYLREKCGE